MERQAELNLSYTMIVAPVDGTGRRAFAARRSIRCRRARN